MSATDSGRRFALSLAAGLLLIPLSATAGFAIINGIATAPDEPATTLPVEPEASTTTSTTELVVDPVAATPYDLALACGADGTSLVAAEVDGTISDVQQAALDALRQICADAGMALADPVAPAPVVRMVVSSGTSPTTTIPHRPRDDEDHEDSDDHEEEDKEDDEHEDDEDDHDERDHEDEDDD